MRALSLKFQRDIIVVAPSQVCYYPWDKEVTSACKGEEGSFPFIGFNDGGSSIQKEKFDLPDAAFHPSSLIVMYNGRDHFWATYKQHEVYGHEAPNLFEVKTKCDLRLWPKSSLTALPNTTADVMESPATEARTAASSLLQLGQAAVSRPRRSQRS